MDTNASTVMEVEVPQSATNPLAALPLELLFRIARYLSTVEFCALRLSCRAVEQGLFHTFSHEFFSRKQFMMSDFSLKALVDIARHPNLSNKLEHVSFGLENLGRFRPRENDLPEQACFYHAALSDQSTIFSSGRAVEMLTEAFAHLPNLKTVSMRDWNSRTRFRDFDSGLKHWHSYGFPTFVTSTGHRRDTNRINERAGFTTNVFNAVSAALAKSGARPENIELMLRDPVMGLLESGFWVPPRAFEQEKYKGMLAGLRKLHLSIVIGQYPEAGIYAVRQSPRLRANPPTLDDQGLKSDLNCNRYIACTAQSLEWLRINFHVNEVEGADAFMTYFTNPSNSKNSEDKIVYPKLKQLDIGRVEVAPTSLCAMLEGLPTIETLILFNTTLMPNITVLSSPGPGEMQWQKLLVRLPTILPKLQRVEVYGALESAAGNLHVVVLERDHYDFIIQVEDGENAMDECAKAADKLGYRQDTPEIDSENGVTEDENNDSGADGDDGDDGGQQIDDNGNAMD
ncbi:f-box domain-containing protein [Ophiostoma piceae UAMH 11346]|uniref:F-box domain-containing protein n=1 Tax=Ophiostoma piceae (strain UAMH 11346) TaxID=1262450 RepID=S3CQC5_OPHP1|nr:f-box domain-containing protein [Ophiostoma piceae UAMH 11346]